METESRENFSSLSGGFRPKFRCPHGISRGVLLSWVFFCRIGTLLVQHQSPKLKASLWRVVAANRYSAASPKSFASAWRNCPTRVEESAQWRSVPQNEAGLSHGTNVLPWSVEGEASTLAADAPRSLRARSLT